MKYILGMTAIYGVAALAALLLLIGYWKLIKKKSNSLSYVFIAVFVIDAGYFMLSMSKTLQEAVMVKWLVDLTATFLPVAMFMLIAEVCKIPYNQKCMVLQVILGIIVFYIAKEYESLHNIYGIYLFSYFILMTGSILYTAKKRKNIPYKTALFLLVVVLGNMLIWFIERLVSVEFEFLTIFLIFTESMLLIFYTVLEDSFLLEKNHIQDTFMADEPELFFDKIATEHSIDNRENPQLGDPDINMEADRNFVNDKVSLERKKEEIFNCLNQKIPKGTFDGLENLSIREAEVLLLILDNKKRRTIAEELEISENTIKKHTAHIFKKLGVVSRKELLEKCENGIL